MTPRRRKLIEAMFMSDTGDERSYDDIYGENGINDNEILTSADAAKELSSEDILKIKDLATQILSIINGEDFEDDSENQDLNQTIQPDNGEISNPIIEN